MASAEPAVEMRARLVHLQFRPRRSCPGSTDTRVGRSRLDARLVAAITIIVICVGVGVVALAVTLPKRRREKLRRRGIKNYGH